MGFKTYAANLVAISCIGVYITATKLDFQWDLVGFSNLIDSSCPNFVSSDVLLCIRAAFLAIITYTVVFMFVDKEGLRLQLVNPADKLIDVHLFGIQRFSAFTVWSWTLQGVYFLLVTLCAVADKYSPALKALLAPHQWLLTRLIWGAFEVSFAMSFMVTTVVTFILIPSARRNYLPHDNFFKILPLLMHNFNVVFMCAELFFNKLPILLSHNALCFWWGMVYTIFAMYWFQLHGFFFYFFLDYSKPLAPVWTWILIGIYSLFFSSGHYLSLLVRGDGTNNAEVQKYMAAIVAFTLFSMQWPPKNKRYIMTDDIRIVFPFMAQLFNKSRKGIADDRIKADSEIDRSKLRKSPRKAQAQAPAAARDKLPARGASPARTKSSRSRK